MYKMLKSYNNNNIMFRESITCFKTMFTVNSLKCNFHFMPVYTFTLATF